MKSCFHAKMRKHMGTNQENTTGNKLAATKDTSWPSPVSTNGHISLDTMKKQLGTLLIIPLLLTFVGAYLSNWTSENIAPANRQQDIKRVQDQQQEELLRTYLDGMSELMLNKELKTNLHLQSTIRARSLVALHRLDAEHQSIVLQF